MRASILLVLSVWVLGCGGDDGSSGDGDGDEASHYCCTIREYCLSCGCSEDDFSTAEAEDEAACKQLIDSEDYSCTYSDEEIALAECVDQAGPSNPGASGCVEWGDGCTCSDDEPSASDVPFAGTCDENGVGDRGLCCQGQGYCNCEPVLCGISAINGHCLCGVGVIFDSMVASCDGTATTCCTQDTGYCYCEDGCQDRFGNSIVSTCNASTTAATCSDGEVQVSTCE